MAIDSPKVVRRRILSILYESFLVDPLQMLSPSDILEAGRIPRQSLTPNAYYLHDRGLIELMTGYNPPMFAAARIMPAGVDLYENRAEFNQMFPLESPEDEDEEVPVPAPLLARLAAEAETCSLDGLRREWLMDDLTRLRNALRKPHLEWEAPVVLGTLEWLEALFEAADGTLDELPTFAELRDALNRYFRQSPGPSR